MFVPRKRVDGLHQVIQSGGWYWNAHNAAPLYLPRGIRLVPSLSLFGLGWSGAIWPQKCKIACASDYFLWLVFLSTALCGGCSQSHANQASTSVVFAPALDTGVTVAVPTTSPLKFTDSNLIFSSQKLWKIELLDRKTFQNNATKIYCSNVFRAFLQSGSSHPAFFCIFLEVTRRKHLMNSYDIFVISLDVHIFLCLCLNRSYHCDRFCGIVASSPLIFLSHFCTS